MLIAEQDADRIREALKRRDSRKERDPDDVARMAHVLDEVRTQYRNAQDGTSWELSNMRLRVELELAELN